MHQPDHRSDRAPGFWARLLLAAQVLVALGLLAAALVPISASASPSPMPEANEALLEEGEVESEELECELEEEVFEETGICGEEEPGSSGGGCPLRSAHGHAATLHDRLKVTIGYTSSEPTAAKIQIQAGAHPMSFRRHLGKSGVLRFTEKRGEQHGNRVVVLIQPTGAVKCSARRLVLSLSS
jgi:hypothetical protein